MSSQSTPRTARSSASSTPRTARAPVQCDDCESAEAEAWCEDCALSYCQPCSRYLHRKGRLQLHNVQPLNWRRLQPPKHRQRAGSADASEASSAASSAATTPTVSRPPTLRRGETDPTPPSSARRAARGARSPATATREELAAWSADQVAVWLERLGLAERYAEGFREAGVTGADLAAVESQDFFAGVGVSSRLHRAKLFRELVRIVDPTRCSPSVSPDKRVRPKLNVDVAAEHKAPAGGQHGSHKSPVAAATARALQGGGGRAGGVVRATSASPRAPPLSTKHAKALDHQKRVWNEERQKRLAPASPPPAAAAAAAPDLAADAPTPQRHGVAERKSTGGIAKPSGLSLGLKLDLDQVQQEQEAQAEEESYEYSTGGTLKTHGFEIKTDGMSAAGSARLSGGATLASNLIYLEELGKGSSGRVFKAMYVPTMRLVAVKMIRVFDAQTRHQLVSELQSLHSNFVPIQERDHPQILRKAPCSHLVSFYDAFTIPEKAAVAIVIEYMDAGTLQDLISAGVRPTEKLLASVAYGVVQGLNDLHSLHKFHRDIKPSNILIGRSGDVKVSDFGIARDLDNTLAKAETFTGTLHYMSPERIGGGAYSYPSDIWAFGLTLVYLATGEFPLPVSDGYWGIVHAVQQRPAPELPEGEYSPELRDFTRRCLEKDPTCRATVRDLLAHPFLAGEAERFEARRSKKVPPRPWNADTTAETVAVADRYFSFLYKAARRSRVPNPRLPPLSARLLTSLAQQLGVPVDPLHTLFQERQERINDRLAHPPTARDESESESRSESESEAQSKASEASDSEASEVEASESEAEDERRRRRVL